MIPKKEGVCKMCNKPLLVIQADGKLPMFCNDCLDKIQQKTKMAMQKRGKIVGNKKVQFRY